MAAASEFSGTVIVNEELRKLGLCGFFEKYNSVGIRVTTSTLANTCIFPKCSMAFLILQSHDFQNNCKERIEKFVKVHAKAFVVFVIPHIEEDFFNFLSFLQLKLFPSSFMSLFADSLAEAVCVMIETVTSHSPQSILTLEEFLTQFFTKSASEDVVKDILHQLELSTAESSLVLDGCGSLGNLLGVTLEEFLEFGLDETMAYKLISVFHKNSPEFKKTAV